MRTSVGQSGIDQDGVARLLANHVYGRDYKEAGDTREHGGIYDAQILCAIDAEITIEHRHRIVTQSNPACAGCVMTPGFTFNELFDLLACAYLRSGNQFLLVNVTDMLIHSSHELNTIDNGVQIIARRVAAFVKVTKVNFGSVERIARFQSHVSGGVARVSL